MDSPDELSDPTTHPCYDLISSTTLTWECVELLGTAAVKEVQCGHTADVCTAVKFSKVRGLL